MGTASGVSGPPMALLYQHPEGPRARLCRPPPWLMSTSRAAGAADTGDQRTPGTSPRVKLRSTTPSNGVSAMKFKCMVMPFESA